MDAAQINAYSNIGLCFGIVLVGFLSKLDAYKATKVRNKIHTLVNGNLQAQLRIIWLQADRIADITKEKTDRIIADEAKSIYENHKRKQEEIDSNP